MAIKSKDNENQRFSNPGEFSWHLNFQLRRRKNEI